MIVNAVADRDIEVLVASLLDAEAAGCRFRYNTAASFVRVRAGLASKPLLTSAETRSSEPTGGLAVVGSHVNRTNEQLTRALEIAGVEAIELVVRGFVREERVGLNEAAAISAEVDRLLGAGRDVVLYTSRESLTAATVAESVVIGQRVSRALCAIVEGLTVRPRFLIAKGGTTASDLATSALGVQRAMALGQLLPGVPVWELGPESKFPSLRYVVFPGNVGGPDSLADAIHHFLRAANIS